MGKFIHNAKSYFNSMSSELKNELNVLDDIREAANEVNKSVGKVNLDE